MNLTTKLNSEYHSYHNLMQENLLPTSRFLHCGSRSTEVRLFILCLSL